MHVVFLDKIKKILAIMAFSWYVFPVFFQGVPSVAWMFIYAAVPLIYFSVNYKRALIYARAFQKCEIIYLPLILLLIWSLIVIVCTQSYDFSFLGELANLAKNIIVYIFLFDLLGSIWEEKNKQLLFMKTYIIVCFLYIASTLLFIAFPELKNHWNDIIILSEMDANLTNDLTYFTRYGWSGFSGFTISFKILIGEIFLLYFASRCRFVSMLMIAMGIGAFCYGRIGGFLSILVIVIYGINQLYVQGIKFIFDVFKFLLLLSLMFSVAFYYFSDNMFAMIWVKWVSAPIESFFYGINYGQVDFGGSTNHMIEDMYFIPEENTLIWGDGYYINPDGSYYMHTDVGVMRSVLFYGLVGCLIGYGALFAYCAVVYKIMANNKDRIGMLCAILIFVVTMIYEFKGLNFVIPFGVLSIMYIANKKEKYDNPFNNCG
ncbi:hypothetical protein [Selenomonas sp. WCT3]|uniref:hypothetical protein n=1 Tax=Selenomonas sp. WCT3 TaxID=3158785 RepID=UPI000942343B